MKSHTSLKVLVSLTRREGSCTISCMYIDTPALRLLPLWEANTLKVNRPSEIDAAYYVTRLRHRGTV